MTSSGNVVARLERMKQKAQRIDAAAVIQLPLWPESKRGTPNSFIRSALFSAIQGKDRAFMKEQALFSQNGITVKYTGEQLNQEDLTLWETLVHLAKGNPLGNVCSFTAHGLLKALGRQTGGDEHRRLHSGIIRLTACAVEIIHDDRRYFGSLIKSGVKDELTRHYAIELNRELIRLYGETTWTAIDWKQRGALTRKPLAQSLHALYSSHRTPYPVTFDYLRRVTGSRNSSLRDFKRKCVTAHDELIAVDFLESYSTEKDKVSVIRKLPKL
jgi:hypothetical protein